MAPDSGARVRQIATTNYQVLSQDSSYQNAHVVWRLLAAMMMTGDKYLRKVHDDIVMSGYQKDSRFLKQIGYCWGTQNMNKAEQQIINSRFWMATQQDNKHSFAPDNVWNAWFATNKTNPTPQWFQQKGLNATYWGNLVQEHDPEPYKTLWVDLEKRYAKRYGSRLKQKHDALKVNDQTCSYIPGGLVNLPVSDPFHAESSKEAQILYLIRSYGLLSPKYLDDDIQIVSLAKDDICGNNTEAIWYVKVKNGGNEQSTDMWTIRYVVKVPKKSQQGKEVPGLVWARELLSHLPLADKNDWPQLKFHEVMFGYLDQDVMKVMIFLHGAKGSPLYDLYIQWNQSLTSNTATTNDKRKYLDIISHKAQQLAQLEKFFMRGDPNQPTSLYTIVFFDAHDNNIFYDEQTGQFSWIDLSTLGCSAKAYFDPKIKLGHFFHEEYLRLKSPVGMSCDYILNNLLNLNLFTKQSKFNYAMFDTVLLSFEAILGKDLVKKVGRLKFPINHLSKPSGRYLYYFVQNDRRGVFGSKSSSGFKRTTTASGQPSTQCIEGFLQD